MANYGLCSLAIDSVCFELKEGSLKSFLMSDIPGFHFVTKGNLRLKAMPDISCCLVL
jgi:hypothetical protein